MFRFPVGTHPGIITSRLAYWQLDDIDFLDCLVVLARRIEEVASEPRMFASWHIASVRCDASTAIAIGSIADMWLARMASIPP